jgi:hypothetical protein
MLIAVLLLALVGCELGSLAAAGPGEAAHQKLHDWGTLPYGDDCGCFGLSRWDHHHPRVSNLGKLTTMLSALVALACGDMLNHWTPARLVGWVKVWMMLAVLGVFVGLLPVWGPEPVHKFIHWQPVFRISQCYPPIIIEHTHMRQAHPIVAAAGLITSAMSLSTAVLCLWLWKRVGKPGAVAPKDGEAVGS